MNDFDTLRPEVRDALFSVGKRCDAQTFDTLSTELLRLASENADLKSGIELDEQVWVQRDETLHRWIERARTAEAELAALKARIIDQAQIPAGGLT